MTLKEHLREAGISYEAFGATVGLSTASISRICARSQNVGLTKAQEIVDATGGAVAMETLIPERA